ncbi:hypothetical protein FocnCong_v021352 [Fusarium oxysporum f. sp. conglutinans]|nr:hypothetical protein FocnCong_v021352 [Fusarium oxysporum f. sp. conglutinans]
MMRRKVHQHARHAPPAVRGTEQDLESCENQIATAHDVLTGAKASYDMAKAQKGEIQLKLEALLAEKVRLGNRKIIERKGDQGVLALVEVRGIHWRMSSLNLGSICVLRWCMFCQRDQGASRQRRLQQNGRRCIYRKTEKHHSGAASSHSTQALKAHQEG